MNNVGLICYIPHIHISTLIARTQNIIIEFLLIPKTYSKDCRVMDHWKLLLIIAKQSLRSWGEGNWVPKLNETIKCSNSQQITIKTESNRENINLFEYFVLFELVDQFVFAFLAFFLNIRSYLTHS